MKKIFLLAALAITIVACNNEYNYIDEPVAARINATIGDPVSRAINTGWDKGDTIGITMSGLYTNMKYTTENGDGAFDGSLMYFRNKQTPITVSAYYPYTGTEGATPAVMEASTAIEYQNETDQRRFDYLYAVKENVTGADPNVNLTFSHKMCKLTFIFLNGNDGTNVSKITTCRISGLVQEGTFNPVGGICTAKAETPASDLILTPTVTHNQALSPLIVFPQTVGEVTLKITDSDAQDYGCVLNFDGNRLESGNNYFFTIKVKKTGMNIDKYEIAPWDETVVTANATSE